MDGCRLLGDIGHHFSNLGLTSKIFLHAWVGCIVPVIQVEGAHIPDIFYLWNLHQYKMLDKFSILFIIEKAKEFYLTVQFIYNLHIQMGNHCSICVQPQNSIFQKFQTTGETLPHPEFAYLQQMKYQVPCIVNHTFLSLGQLRVDEQQERGTVLQPYYVVPYDLYYAGEWANGKPHGVGEITFKNGSIFKGTFTNGIAKGHDCLFVMTDGSYYRGDIDKNKFEGIGVLNQKNGHHFKGYWHDNIPNGDGVEIFQNGDKYEGNYTNGKKQGLNCRYAWKNSPEYESYEGGYKDDYFFGRGELKKKNGTVIKGKFDGDDIEMAHVKNENYEYEGDVREGKLNGKGKIKFMITENEYEGQFIKGQIHGKGVMTYKDGQRKEGVWFYGRHLHQLKGFSEGQADENLRIIDEILEKVETFEELLVETNNLLSKRTAQYYKEQHRRYNKLQVIEVDKKLISFYE